MFSSLIADMQTVISPLGATWRERSRRGLPRIIGHLVCFCEGNNLEEKKRIRAALFGRRFFRVLNILVVGFACDTTKGNCNRKSNGNRNGKNNRKVLRPKEGLRMTR